MTWTGRLTWVLSISVPLAASGWLIWKANTLRASDKVEPGNHIHLPTGIPGTNGGVLFTLKLSGDEGALAIHKGRIAPRAMDGTSPTEVVVPQRLLVGRYFYQFTRPTKGSSEVNWQLLGARVRMGEAVGRNPGLMRSPSGAYEPETTNGRELALWMDGMPTLAFTALWPKDCPDHQGVVCLEFHDQAGRITLERRGTAPTFVHLKAGEKQSVARDDILWISNFPYLLQPVPGGNEVDFTLADKYDRLRGDRRGLGAPGLNGSAVLGNADAFYVEDVTAQFKEGHLGKSRWDPEAEDELQYLIDQGMLCLGYKEEPSSTPGTEPGHGDATPELLWTDLSSGQCPDPLQNQPSRIATAVPAAMMEMYIRHKQNDAVVRRTNERLKKLPGAGPRDFPFVFEWWPVATAAGVVRMPTRLWGIRTGSTFRSLTSGEDADNGEADPRQVTLLSRNGQQSVLARSVNGDRVYARGKDMLGLGPLLGIRGSVDGLDEIVPEGGVNLTIDPDLQRSLWERLKVQSRLANPPTLNQSAHFGVSGVVMDAANGDIVSVLNWPAGLVWERPELIEGLRAIGSWGVPEESRNGAMLRADKVGSVFKLLAIYTMAQTGILDGSADAAGPSCGKEPFGLLETHGGRIQIKAAPFEDPQPGPLPVGKGGLINSLDGATASSCNTYFALAATMLLDSNTPELAQVESCPVDDQRRRTDRNRPTADKWLFCHWGSSGSRRQGRARRDQTHWLLLPENESLADRSRRAFQSEGSVGYFERALQAGVRLGYPEATKDRDVYRLADSGQASYEGREFRIDWMPGMPQAPGRVFRYPIVFSPLSHFGGGDEKFGNQTEETLRDARSWREFAAQAIGEAGEGSALSIAALYSAVGREDGAIPAPRLIDTGPVSTRQIFDPKGQRVQRIRQALLQPLVNKAGTAQGLGISLKNAGIGDVFGKTGTFDMIVSAPLNDGAANGNAPAAANSRRCAVPETLLLENQGPVTPVQLGLSQCEGNSLVTGVHRYPFVLPAVPTAAPLTRRLDAPTATEKHTTFAAILLPRRPGGHPIVAVLIADIPEIQKKNTAAQLIEPLLKEIDRWMR